MKAWSRFAGNSPKCYASGYYDTATGMLKSGTVDLCCRRESRMFGQGAGTMSGPIPQLSTPNGTDCGRHITTARSAFRHQMLCFWDQHVGVVTTSRLSRHV